MIKSILISVLMLALSAQAQEAKESTLPVIGDPAHILDNANWLKEFKSFRADSETRAYTDLVAILYDWDNQRPWGKQYFPEANRRIGAFRSVICEKVQLKICTQPGILWTAADVAMAEANLVDAETVATLAKRWNVKITAWLLPGRQPMFTLLVARSAVAEKLKPSFWDMKPQDITLTSYFDELLPEATSYRAGFDSKDAPSMIAVNSQGLFINDRQLRQRAADLAVVWKRAIASLRRNPSPSQMIDAEELQMQRLYLEQANEFARLHTELRLKVAAVPEIAARFDAERAKNDYAEEVYQHVAFAQLSSLARTQGAYFTLAAEQRRESGARARALESLLTLQRYTDSPRAFALEVLTLIQPLASHAFVLDANADATIAMTFVAENLKAVLGLDHYTERGTFPLGGKGLLAPEIFESDNLKLEAPQVVALLAGRKVAALSADEQLEVLRLYLRPSIGKINGLAAIRLGTLFLQNASREELQQLAEMIAHRDETRASHASL